MKRLFLVMLISGWISVNYGTASEKTYLNWELGYSEKYEKEPVRWIKSMVPGAVQLDIAKAEKYQSFFYAEHWKDYLWMEDQYYTYRTSFENPHLAADERLFFVSGGIDYEFEIIFNDEKIFYQEGMFTPVNLDLTEKIKENNTLIVLIYPVPKLHALPADRSQAAQVVKPAVSYGWDWHPRLVPLGIWDETYLEIQNSAGITSVEMNYILNKELTRADINLDLAGRNLDGKKYRWMLADANGAEVLRSEGIFHDNEIKVPLKLIKPRLWWPHDQGIPYLYTSTLQLFDINGKLIQTKISRTGFRTIRLVMNEGAWKEPSGFPKTRSVPPMQFEINGRKIFCKGTNWVNPEIFPGIITRERYNRLLDLALEANFNILRVWGGGIVNKESFFDLCDEKGILVWQEFPLACNDYTGSPRYLSVLEQESASIIKRLRKHASLALWCGGNELFNNWSGMTDQSAALRLLNSQCFLLDQNTPFIPTSPVMGMGHGNYVFRDRNSGEEVFQEMARSKFTAYTEFGMPAPASVEILKTIIPETELWPPKPGTSWESHHAFNSWQENTWLCRDIIEEYFGPSESLEELVKNGQLLQGEGYKCIYEEARRQKPYCSVAANWCYNEPWPTAANNSLISWPDIPKPGFYAVSNACRPVLASARFNKFKWSAGETIDFELWILNDLPEDVAPGKVKVKVVSGSEEIQIHEWIFSKMNANTNQQGPVVRYKLPLFQSDRFKIILEVEGHPEFNSDYTFAYRK